MIELTEIVEGETRLLVPVNERLLKRNVVFYNPVMEMNGTIVRKHENNGKIGS